VAQSLSIKVKNLTGFTLLRGKAVKISGFDATDQVLTVSLASRGSQSTLPAIGLVSDDILNNNIGFIKTSGIITDIDTEGTSTNYGVFVGDNGGLIFSNSLVGFSSNTYTQQVGRVIVSDKKGKILLFPVEFNTQIEHPDILNVFENQHHNKLHSNSHAIGEEDDLSSFYLPRDGSKRMFGDIDAIGGYKTSIGQWAYRNVPASTIVLMGSVWINTTPHEYRTPFSGSIRGITVREPAEANISGSDIAFTVLINENLTPASLNLSIGLNQAHATFEKDNISQIEKNSPSPLARGRLVTLFLDARDDTDLWFRKINEARSVRT